MKTLPVLLWTLVLPGALRAGDATMPTSSLVAAPAPATTTTEPADHSVRPADPEEVRNEKTNWKLENLKIAKVDLADLPVSKAFEKLAALSGQADSQKSGVGFCTPGGPHDGPKITLSMTDAKLKDVIAAICEQAGFKYTVVSGSIWMSPASDNSPQLLAKNFDVPPMFFTFDDPELNKGKAANLPDTRYVDVSDKMKTRGILFPPMGHALYYPKKEQVRITTTEEQIVLVETMLKPSAKP